MTLRRLRQPLGGVVALTLWAVSVASLGCQADPFVPEVVVLPGDTGGGDPAMHDPPWWDSAYGFRTLITIAAEDPVSVLHTVSVVVDHAEMVKAGQSLDSGDDLRVACYEDTTWRELHRAFENPNDVQSRLVFRVPHAFASTEESGECYLYSGNTAPPTPLSEPREIYFYSTDFTDETEFLNDWTVHYVDQVGDFGIRNGALEKTINSFDTALIPPYVNDKAVLSARPQLDAVRITLRFDFTADVVALDDDLLGVGLCTDDAEPEGFYLGFTGGDDWFTGEYVTPPMPDTSAPAFGYWEDAALPQSDYVPAPLDLSAGDYVAVMDLVAGGVRSELDGNALGELRVAPEAPGYLCIIAHSMADIRIEGFRAAVRVPQEPTVSLGATESY